MLDREVYIQKMDHKAMAEQAVEMGAFKAAVIGIESFTFDPVFREMCRANLCGNYGLCWTCPPDVGDISQLIAEARTYNWGLVYQTVNKLEAKSQYRSSRSGSRQSQTRNRPLSNRRSVPTFRSSHQDSSSLSCPG